MARPRTAPNEAQQAIAAEYVTVAERIQQFYADHPEGKLEVVERDLVKDGDYTSWVVWARAYPDYRIRDWYSDGVAEERRPGLTPFTRNSELQNAETAAKGRAIAFLGYATHAGVATAEEIRARDSERELTDDGSPTEEQKQELARLVAVLEELREAPWLDEIIEPWIEANVGQTIDEINRGQFRHVIAKVERMVEKLREEVEAEASKETAE